MPESLRYLLHFKWTVVTQGDAKTVNVLTGEASASTMWDNQAWSYVHADREDTEPPFLAQDFIHTVQPGAKIIIMLRDPVERYCREIHSRICLYRLFWFLLKGFSSNLSLFKTYLFQIRAPICASSKISFCSNWLTALFHPVPRLYSDYLYFKMANKSAEDFHLKVIESVQLFKSCLSERSLRSCVYNTSLSNTMPVSWNYVFNFNRLNTMRIITVFVKTTFNYTQQQQTFCSYGKKNLSVLQVAVNGCNFT